MRNRKNQENQEVQELIEEGFAEVSLDSNGNAIIVKFLGSVIWDSEEDVRTYDEEEDKYIETIEDFLRKQIIEMVRVLPTIKL